VIYFLIELKNFQTIHNFFVTTNEMSTTVLQEPETRISIKKICFDVDFSQNTHRTTPC